MEVVAALGDSHTVGSILSVYDVMCSSYTTIKCTVSIAQAFYIKILFKEYFTWNFFLFFMFANLSPYFLLIN